MAYNNYGNYTMRPASGPSINYGSPFGNSAGPRAYSPRRRANYVNSPPKKRSGCTVKVNYTTKSGKLMPWILQGWKYTKRTGMISILAVPASAKYQTENPNYNKVVVTVTTLTGQSTFWANFNVSKQILIINELKMVASGRDNYVSYIKPKNR